MQSETIHESASYCYEEVANVGSDATWGGVGTADAGGSGSTTSSYSGSGSFSTTSGDRTFSSTLSEHGASGDRCHYLIDHQRD